MKRTNATERDRQDLRPAGQGTGSNHDEAAMTMLEGARQGSKPSGGAASEGDAAEARFYLRVTVVVAVAMAIGAALEGVPAEPSSWRWVPLGIAYLVGGARIARESWRTLREERKLSIDILMGNATSFAGRPWPKYHPFRTTHSTRSQW